MEKVLSKKEFVSMVMQDQAKRRRETRYKARRSDREIADYIWDKMKKNHR